MKVTVYSNQPTHVQKKQSSYPFDKKSSLLFQLSIFPTQLIKSCIINIRKAVFPIYISEFLLQDNKVYMRLADTQETLGYVLVQKDKTLCPILSSNDTVLGSMQVDNRLYQFLQSRLKNMFRFTHTCTSDNFIISSQCINCCWINGYQVLNIDDYRFKNDVVLDFRNNATYDISDNTVNVFGDLQVNTVAASKVVYVNGQDMRNKGLVIQHKMLSDIRVVSKNTITMTSVLDA